MRFGQCHAYGHSLQEKTDDYRIQFAWAKVSLVYLMERPSFVVEAGLLDDKKSRPLGNASPNLLDTKSLL